MSTMRHTPIARPFGLTPRSVTLGAGRVDEAEQRFPSHTPLMLLLSLAYVVLALAYSARLIDMIGVSLSEAQLRTVATWSQTLFGCAVALALWGGGVLPRLEGSHLSWRRRWLILVSAGIVGIAASVLLQRAALSWMTADPTGARQRQAVQLNMLARATLDARVAVPELHLAPEQLQGPAGKTFLALLLATELSDPAGSGVSDEAVRKAMQEAAAQRLGTAAQIYDNVFVPSVRSLKDAYNAYVAAQTALVDDIRGIVEQQNRAWNDYLEGLARRNINPAKLNRAEWPGIVAEVRQTGVNVPSDWNPADRAAYVTALSTAQRKQADAQYAERLNRLFGTELPPGLEWEQFHANPIVQARWRAAINAPTDAVLSPTMGFPLFEATVYRPMIDQIIEPRLRELLAPAAAYAPGGRMAPLGQLAAMRIALPAIALVLILAGLVWHGCGLVTYAARLALPRWPGRRRCVALVLAICALFVLGARHPITRSEGFGRWQDQIADHAGPAWLAGLGVVEAYGLVQPWGDTLRRTVLGQPEFGLDAFANARAEPPATLDRLLP